MIFQKSLRPCALDESSLSIGRVKFYLSFSEIEKLLLFFLFPVIFVLCFTETTGVFSSG